MPPTRAAFEMSDSPLGGSSRNIVSIGGCSPVAPTLLGCFKVHRHVESSAPSKSASAWQSSAPSALAYRTTIQQT